MERRNSLVAQLRREQSGASAAELALIMPLLALMLTGVFDIGSMAWTRMQVAASARAGASYALTKGYNKAMITTAITSATSLPVTATVPDATTLGCPNAASGITTAGVTSATTCSTGGTPGTYVTVGASADYHLLFGWPGVANPVALSASSTVRIS